MKLRQIVCDETDLTLTKERKIVQYHEIFEVSKERGEEILNANYKGQPVAEIVIETEITVGKQEENKVVETQEESVIANKEVESVGVSQEENQIVENQKEVETKETDETLSESKKSNKKK